MASFFLVTFGKLSRAFCLFLILRITGHDEDSLYLELSEKHFSVLKWNQHLQVNYGTKAHNQNLHGAWRTLLFCPGKGIKTAQRKPSLNSQFQDCHRCWKKKMLNLMNIKTARPRILCLALCPIYNYQCVIVSCYCYFHCQVSCACFLCWLADAQRAFTRW